MSGGDSGVAGATAVSAGTADFSAVATADFGAGLTVSGGAINLSATGTTTIGTLLNLSGGALIFGAQNDAVPALSQSNSVLSGTGTLTVNGAAAFSGFAVTESGAGTTLLKGSTTLDTAAALYLDGGRVVENQGSLGWGSGEITAGVRCRAAARSAAARCATMPAARSTRRRTIRSAPAPAARRSTMPACSSKSAGTGNTRVGTTLDNAGTVEVRSGTITLQQSVSGAGLFDIDGAVVLDFAAQVTGGAQVSFASGSGGTLALDNPGTLFGGSVSGFVAGDTIDFGSEQFTLNPAVSFNAGTLTIDDGVHAESIPLIGSYTNLSFQTVADAHGGTAVLHT